MGREIYCQLRKVGQTLEEPAWDSVAVDLFVCGRDEATNFVAMRAGKDCEICLSDPEEMRIVVGELRSYAKKDADEVDKVKGYMRDLKAARGNARTLDEFASFNPEIERAEQWLREESWSRAKGENDMINEALSVKKAHPFKYAKTKLYLVVSE